MYSVTPIPAFRDNYIWALQGDQPGLVAVVDPGDAAPVERYLAHHALSLAAILITHHHPDHTGGVAELTAQRDIPVYGPENSPFGGITQPLHDKMHIELLGHSLEVRAVPGHTLDHISYFQSLDQPQLFCGDTLFLAGCGRLFEGTAAQMHDAMNYFASLPESTLVYCTHEYSLSNLMFAKAVEPDNSAIDDSIEQCQKMRERDLPTLPSTIGSEKQINPFMRTAQQSVIAAAQTQTGTAQSDPVKVLATLREWKNRF
ncbi:hydroxyacylglutathione hydrolase [Marinobacterium zhoushanense]|uniref:Hydroxyacylglutathione hydrolase n=1 Tax=Marinobacterium zhoushanense TaxID=1679163 RepID=A0ABQ1KK36_9GAMM|nr:hydroxyacylglutathione hydrolase [Marinobacterium zhoushanense]GGC02690.1 hydroxyacylglutathione hydrolase [Marinobacterium zhoushanense]